MPRGKKTHEQFVNEVFELVGNEYKVMSIYESSRKKVKMKHNHCLHEYEVVPTSFLKGRRCGKCFGNNRKTTSIFKEEVYELTGKEYEVVGEYVTAHQKITMKHIICNNEYKTEPNDFLKGSRCPFCSGRYATFENCLENRLPDIAKEWHPTKNGKLTPFNVTWCSGKKVWWICDKGHEWEVKISNRVSKGGTGCPVCSQSKGEKEIRDWLSQHVIDFEPQKEYDQLLGTGGRNLSYDFYLPNENILIEYQGEFHDGSVSNQKEEDFKKQQEHDKRKREYALQNNIGLLEIWYWDFDKIEKILYEYILVQKAS